jgi:hypothetical protein
MRTVLVLTASSLALAGCGKASYAVAKLECPVKEGELTRVSVSPDGKSCAYRASDGAEVSLELTPVVGTAKATLAKIEAQLRSTPGPNVQTGTRLDASIQDATAAKAGIGAMAAEVARVQAEAAADAKMDVKIASDDRKTGDGPHRIDLPGVHISEEGDDANVRIGPLQVDSNGEDTTVNIYRDVRMRGEALSREKRGLRATFIYTGKDLPSGYRYVGYAAGGPKAGPLTVAKVRSKIDTESGDKIYEDVQELVRRNGGV